MNEDRTRADARGDPSRHPTLSSRVIAAVVAVWTLVGVVSGTQNALGASMQGSPVPLTPTVRDALLNTLPWIPATLIVVGLTARFPVRRDTWRRNVWIHVLAIPVVALLANSLVVLGFRFTSGSVGSPAEILRQAAFWATIRIHVAVFYYVAIAAVTQAGLYYRATRDREIAIARLESHLARARLQALNAQIRPHFLFNTLHTIGQLWRAGHHERADALLDQLGALFQKVQTTSDQLEIPLREELEMVEDYLAIEEARFGDRLRTRVEATDEAARCTIPPLLLQPLVENAIRHGVSASSSASRVTVAACTDGDRLRIVVEDDGPGMDAPSPAPGSGLGLSNTRERVRHAYDGAGSLSVVSSPGNGVKVTLTIPRREGGSDGV